MKRQEWRREHITSEEGFCSRWCFLMTLEISQCVVDDQAILDLLTLILSKVDRCLGLATDREVKCCMLGNHHLGRLLRF